MLAKEQFFKNWVWILCYPAVTDNGFARVGKSTHVSLLYLKFFAFALNPDGSSAELDCLIFCISLVYTPVVFKR